MRDLIIFDKDNTLIYSYPGRPACHPLEQILLPNVAKKCAELRTAGHILAIVSNQGGVASGKITEERVRQCMAHVANLISAYTYRYCPHSSRDECKCRKPEPGMIYSILWHSTVRNYQSVIDRVVFVGDADTDRLAAEIAAVEFCWAHEFFGWPIGFDTVIKE